MLHFHKEGARIILVSTFITTLTILACDKLIETDWIKMTIQLIALFFLIIILQFFRNPNRHIEINDDVIIAPVDGKVVVIEEVFEGEYFKDKRIQVSIFM